MRNRTLEENIEDFGESVKGYITARINLMKLVLLEKVANAVTYIFSVMLAIIVIASSLLLFTLAFSFWYGNTQGSVAAGLLISAIFYVVVGLIIFLLRHRIFTDNIIKNIGKLLLPPEEGNDEK